MDEEPGTISVELAASLLKRLRALHPGKGDREVIEYVARHALTAATLRQTQERNSMTEDEAVELGVRAVHEGRRVPS